MKKFSTLLIFCAFLTTSCQQSPNNPDSPPAVSFDMTGYESSSLGSGVTRVYKRNRNGQIIEEGYVKNGVKQGVWTTFIQDRPESVTSYLDGKKFGKSLKFSHLLYISEEATYKNDMLHGKKGRYKRGRPIEEGEFIENKAHGTHKQYYESGADQGKLRQETNYLNGQIHGTLKTFNASGKVTMQYEYKNGEKISGGIIE